MPFLLVAMETKKKKKRKKILKNYLLCNHWANKAQISSVVSLGWGIESFFMKIGSLVWLLWQLRVLIDL